MLQCLKFQDMKQKLSLRRPSTNLETPRCPKAHPHLYSDGPQLSNPPLKNYNDAKNILTLYL